MSTEPLQIWVIYDHPADYPNNYVARMWLNEKASDNIILSGDMKSLRERMVERGLTKIDRLSGDDPKIVETWL